MVKEIEPPDTSKKLTFLSPINRIIEITGKLFYHESSQAWNLLRFKKELLDKFPYLKDKQGNFMYLMKIPDTYKELKVEIDKMEKASNAVPIMLFLAKQNDRKV